MLFRSADRANVSKPVLYQHFPSKLDLYLAVLDLHIDSLVFALQKAITSTKENKNRVKATVDAYFGFIDDEGLRPSEKQESEDAVRLETPRSAVAYCEGHI